GARPHRGTPPLRAPGVDGPRLEHAVDPVLRESGGEAAQGLDPHAPHRRAPASSRPLSSDASSLSGRRGRRVSGVAPARAPPHGWPAPVTRPAHAPARPPTPQRGPVVWPSIVCGSLVVREARNGDDGSP